jgi:hypothetical protein
MGKSSPLTREHSPLEKWTTTRLASMTAIRAITPGMEAAWIDAGSPTGVREMGEFTAHFLQHQFHKSTPTNPAPPPRKSIP